MSDEQKPVANDFNPDWDVVTPMVEEQQRMAARIQELEAALRGDVEPVAWIGQNPRDGGIELCSFKPAPSVLLDFNMKPLYAHPTPAVNAESVAQSRGYALLGSGRYVLNHSDDFHPELGAELIITFATEFDKQNRQIGEVRDNPDFQTPIEAKDMLIRIGFLNERGLYALENQLSLLRQCHFSDSVNHTTPAVVKQLVDALRMVMDDPDALDGRPRTYECVQEALSAAKGAGL